MMNDGMRTALLKTKIREIEESIALIRDNLPEELGLIKDGIYKRMEFAIKNARTTEQSKRAC